METRNDGPWTVFMILVGIILSLIGIELFVLMSAFGSLLTGLAGWIIYKKFDKTLAWVVWLSLIGHVVFLLTGL